MTTFSLTSFNARWGLTVEDEPFDLIEVVAGFGTDLVSLQEVWEPHQGGSGLDAAAADLGYHLVHVPLSPSYVVPRPEITEDPAAASGTWGVALLSRLPVRSTRIVDLGRVVERWDVADRYAILAELAVGETPVTVTALHLSFALPNALAQLRRLGGYLPRHRPSVVAGDCNLWGPLAATTIGGHRRAVRGRSWPAARPHSQLDHILVSEAVTVLDAAVLPPAGSDHRPVRAVLQVR
ncbi:MAG: endonuclease/exonuclease/phosphatase family protein [Aquihabitans sp.]